MEPAVRRWRSASGSLWFARLHLTGGRRQTPRPPPRRWRRHGGGCDGCRKELLHQGHLSWAAEIAFLDLVFSRHRKSQGAWVHRCAPRRWKWPTLPQLTTTAHRAAGPRPPWRTARSQYVVSHVLRTAAPEAAATLLERELAACGRATEAYPKLYMGWTYRHWVVQRLQTRAQLEAEHRWMRAWLHMHVSDHAAAHHLQGVLARLSIAMAPDLATPLAAAIHPVWLGAVPAGPGDAGLPDVDVRTLWVTEWAWLADLLLACPGHEALWAHRRFLATASAALENALAGAPLGTAGGRGASGERPGVGARGKKTGWGEGGTPR